MNSIIAHLHGRTRRRRRKKERKGLSINPGLAKTTRLLPTAPSPHPIPAAPPPLHRTNRRRFTRTTSLPPPRGIPPPRRRRSAQLPMVIQSIRSVFNDPEIDLANMTPEAAKKAIADHRMKRYKVICFCGAALLVWTDKAALLNRVYQDNHTAARMCIYFFTIALVSILLGVIASSFPDSAPCAKAVAWNGTLQTFLFLNAFFHLRMMELYPELLHLTISFVVTSVLFSIYWSICARDPTVHLVEASHHE